MAQIDEGAPLDIYLEQGPAGATVRLVGEVDISNVDRVRSALEPVLGSEPVSLTFDLQGITFMDTSGIAMLLTASRAAEAARVVNPSDVVRRLLELTGLQQTFHMGS